MPELIMITIIIIISYYHLQLWHITHLYIHIKGHIVILCWGLVHNCKWRSHKAKGATHIAGV